MQVYNYLHKADMVKNEVLAALSNFEEKTENLSVSIVSYKNGRENGYSMKFRDAKKGTKKVITFSENRSSDQIVVYVQSDDDMTEEEYDSREYFSPSSYSDAADYIVGKVVA
jgi:hypothetical protein